MHRSVYAATAVAVASVVTTVFAPGPIAFGLQGLACLLFGLAFRAMPPEGRRRIIRQWRLELIGGLIVCLGLLGMAIVGRFVPDALREPVGLFWLWFPLAYIGLLLVRMMRIVAMRVRRTRA